MQERDKIKVRWMSSRGATWSWLMSGGTIYDHENYHAHPREGAELLVKSEEGLQVMQVIDAAFESAMHGRSVEVHI